MDPDAAEKAAVLKDVSAATVQAARKFDKDEAGIKFSNVLGTGAGGSVLSATLTGPASGIVGSDCGK